MQPGTTQQTTATGCCPLRDGGWGKKISKACALEAASSPHRPAAASCCENCLTQLHDNSRLFPRTFLKRNPLNHDKHTKTSKPIFTNDKTQTKPPVEPLLHAPHNLWCQSECPPSPQGRDVAHRRDATRPTRVDAQSNTFPCGNTIPSMFGKIHVLPPMCEAANSLGRDFLWCSAQCAFK